jgi:hypothetical protein
LKSRSICCDDSKQDATHEANVQSVVSEVLTQLFPHPGVTGVARCGAIDGH